jgi:two-component system sensor histidine kinase KdpD
MKRFSTRKLPIGAQYAICIAVVIIVASICFSAASFIGYRVVALVLLMMVSFLAMLFDVYPVLSAAVLSAMIWNFMFIPPIYTFHIDNAEDVLMFLLYFIIALVNAVLTIKIREAETKARDKEEKENTIKLYNTLLNSLSHELRTPISAILGAVDTLQEKDSNLSEHNRGVLLREIDTAGMRLNRQVDNLLNMSRLESGMLMPKYDWCDMEELVYNVIQKIEPGYTQQITLDAEENLPLFKLDAGLMEQVIYNIIHNAIQYTPADTKINIRLKHNDLGCTCIISDNGPGFPTELIQRAFDKFYRMPVSRVGGSGLGLSIVKGFIEAHKGTVTLSNLPTGGACFEMTIPAETSYLSNLKNE